MMTPDEAHKYLMHIEQKERDAEMRTLHISDFDHCGNRSSFKRVGIGKKYNPLYGWDFYVMSKDDILALLCGDALYATINDEYAMLIKLEEDDDG